MKNQGCLIIGPSHISALKILMTLENDRKLYENSFRILLCSPQKKLSLRRQTSTVPTITITPGVDPDAMKDRWFLMYGDTDFI